MFHYPKERRLRNNRDYQAVGKSGQRWFVGCWSVHFKANCLLVPRIGIVVPKRVASRAVVRNRIKRIVRESYRMAQNLPCFDMVFVAKNGLPTESRAKLRSDLDKLWDRLRKYPTSQL